jgi:hypothetical protein
MPKTLTGSSDVGERCRNAIRDKGTVLWSSSFGQWPCRRDRDAMGNYLATVRPSTALIITGGALPACSSIVAKRAACLGGASVVTAGP